MHQPRSVARTAPLLALTSLLLVGACGEEAEPGRRETVNGYTVVFLEGTPYEMGRQHARLLREELLAGVEEIRTNMYLKVMFGAAKQLKLDQMAAAQSYPEIVEECKGMVDVLGSEGWTMEVCLVLNFGDPIAEFIQNGMPTTQDLKPGSSTTSASAHPAVGSEFKAPGCAQLVAAGKATADGRLYHARILDWIKIDYVIKYPTLLVRRPTGKIPHVFIGFPGNLSPYQGMNAEGLAISSNEIHPHGAKAVNDLTGESHVQLLARALAQAKSLDDLSAMIKKVNHMTLELFVASEGKTGRAAVYEMAPLAVDTRQLSDGLVRATNHFMGSSTAAMDRDPAKPDTLDRYQRLGQLSDSAGGGDSLYGKLSPEKLVQIMRDRKNPVSGQQSDKSVFDDGKSLATNGALFQVVFDPARRHFWVAAGKTPVPDQPFVGFSLDALLGQGGAHPATIP